MEKMTFIKPINCSKVRNLSITEYLLIYRDQNNQLKRAIPDFREELMSSDDSLINEAINADKIGYFKILSKNESNKTSSPVFCIFTTEDGTISRYSEDVVKLDNLLLDRKRRETASKLLKKKK